MTGNDIFQQFLQGTSQAAFRLSAESDVMDVERLDRVGEGLFRLTFRVPYLVHDGPSSPSPVAAALASVGPSPLSAGPLPLSPAVSSPVSPGLSPGPLVVAVRLAPDYLRRSDPLGVVQCGDPRFWHPNFCWPVLCIGGVTAGTPLDKLCRHIYEIVTYQNYSTDDSLNPQAAICLRDQPQILEQLPAPPRLVRRPLALDFLPST